MRKITIHREKCVGCLTCTAACMVAHFDVDSRSRIILDAKGKYNPIFCKQCERPDCVFACQTGAMHKDEETGIIIYDKERCESCYMCIMSCPYGVLKTNAVNSNVIMKCDMCKSTKENSPNCVDKCPMGAITLE